MKRNTKWWYRCVYKNIKQSFIYLRKCNKHPGTNEKLDLRHQTAPSMVFILRGRKRAARTWWGHESGIVTGARTLTLEGVWEVTWLNASLLLRLQEAQPLVPLYN